MPVSHLHYDLQDGYIHNWLIAGPQAISVAGLGCWDDEEVKEQIAQQHYMAASGITETPVERGSLSEGIFTVVDYEGAWSYVVCREDHLADLSDSYAGGQYLRGWAYAEIEMPIAQTLTFVLSTYGPGDVWVNDVHVHRHAHFSRQLRTVTLQVTLSEGRNRVLVRFEQVAAGACSHAVALRLEGLLPGNREDADVVLPTTIQPVERRNWMEQIFSHAYLDQAVYGRMDDLRVHWDSWEEEGWTPLGILLRKPSGQIYAQMELAEKPETSPNLGRAHQFPDGFYHVVLMPTMREYAEGDLRITRELPLWGLDNHSYSETLYGDFATRRVEALREAARYEDDLYAEIAKMAIGWWSRVEVGSIRRAIHAIKTQRSGSVVSLLGVLGMLVRFGDAPEFPNELKAPADDAILGYRFWQDEPGDDAMDMATEHTRLLFYTCQVLAGQRYPDRVFPNAGETGAGYRRRGEELILDWMRKRATRGFGAWDSDIGFEKMLAGLIHLVEFAETDEVWELAGAMIDKLLYSLAINSYKGVFGGTHGLTEAPQIRNGMLAATSGISRLVWGMGAFNHHTCGTVSLASAQEYTFPRFFQAIATDLPAPLWNRERHALFSKDVEINKVTYRTPDYMLGSVQDYRAGESGCVEHVWQATLGPAATVFVNHPACASEAEAHRPNYWRGNAVLPRVAQWRDLLIAVYALPEDDWMGFTHAYFPLHAFDAHELRAGWAFARKGNGYLALTAARGLELIESGLHARRELRSCGQQNIWLCHMGRAEEDGTFAEFRDAILDLEVVFDGLSVRLETLRDETLAFGWEEPLTRNGQPESLSGFPHYDSPYGVADFPADEMTIAYGDQAMRLRLG